ncbi:hypothetical protein B0H12DRAFT_1233287 [Mycena haematopus]|nr:hypothetical protein B0H12DRAFT_1233287 [Mycena haematopus]
MPSDPSAHAARHPIFRVQLSRRRVGKSKATKASDNLRLEQYRKRRVDFQEAIDTEFERRARAIAEISAAYNKKSTMVRGILNSISQYKSTRAPSLRNAVVHQRAVNYQAEGETKTLKEIQEELQDDINNGRFSLDTMDDEESARLIEGLLEHRKLRRNGVRATAKAAQIDAKQTVARIGDAMGDLQLRTGVCGIAFFSRGNIDDPSLPYIMDTDGAMGFLTEVMQITSLELIRKFETWTCAREEGKFITRRLSSILLTHLAGNSQKNGVSDVRKDVSKYLQEGFRKITNSPNATMEYVHYDVAVREAKGVELAGFPADVQIEKRAEWNVETGRRIREMLKTGAIHWVKMTKSQHDTFVEEQNAKRAALGAGSLRKRKERSDKGQKRGKHANAAATGDPDDSDNGGDNEKETLRPTPRGARASLAPGIGSAVAIGSAAASAPALVLSAAPPLVHIAPAQIPQTPDNVTPQVHTAPSQIPQVPDAVAPLVSDTAPPPAQSPGVPGAAAPPLVTDAPLGPLPNTNDAAAAPLFPDDAGADASLMIQLDPELIRLMEEMEAYMPPLATNFDLTRATPVPSTPPFATLLASNSCAPLAALSTNTAPVAGSKRKHGEGISAEVRAAIGNSGAVPRKKPRQQTAGAGASRGGENAPPPKPRKRRSDAGVPRGSKKSTASSQKSAVSSA